MHWKIELMSSVAENDTHIIYMEMFKNKTRRGDLPLRTCATCINNPIAATGLWDLLRPTNIKQKARDCAARRNRNHTQC